MTLGQTMHDTEVSMKSYYAARAFEYDRVYEKPERQVDIRILQQWLPHLFAGRHLLEIACGTGYWTQFIAPLAANIVALDAAVETIDIAKTRVPREKVQFLVADAYLIPQNISVFDAVFAGFWFSHIPKSRRKEFLVGVSSHLRPGAKIVFVDNRYVEGSNHPISECDDEGNTYQTRKLADGTTHRVLKNFPTESELMEMLDETGVNCRFTNFEYYWAFEYEAKTS
jgi:2-polyprenyl-3-methyl-5-hydroxy-6-metoxy-1,4-benzoquinol methylase